MSDLEQVRAALSGLPDPIALFESLFARAPIGFQIYDASGKSLLVNLPGKPSAIRDCLLAVFPAIPYCVDLIDGPYLTTQENVVKAFRPKK